MSLLDAQLARLRDQFTGATMQPLDGGRFLVHVPNVPLPPDKWSKVHTSVWFLVPVGYPQAAPDSFWADRDLRLAHGGPPQNTQFQGAPDGGQRLWFSWHVQQWLPSRDTLVTYVHLIRKRFEEAR